MFLQVFINVFLAFFIIPLSSGTLYKVAVYLGFLEVAFIAKMLGILTALCINYFLGFILSKIIKRDIPENKMNGIFPFLSFIPVISGVFCFYLGAIKFNFLKFIIIAILINLTYYSLEIFFPILGIYF